MNSRSDSLFPQGDLHAVIMAGGSGTRFWPWSRRSLPKQFLALAGKRSLLRDTFDRLALVCPAERTWVVTSDAHVSKVLEELPEVPRFQVLGEPTARNTAPCIGLAARRIVNRDPRATLLVAPADHAIQPAAAFRDTVDAALLALAAARGDPKSPPTVTLGVPPRFPATGFGYIERGESLELTGSAGRAFRVARFREKPSVSLAEEFLASGRFYWNSGIFLWEARGVLQLLGDHIPELALGLEAIEAQGRGSEDGFRAALQLHFGGLPSISIDYGVLEHAPNVLVVEAQFDWDDVGSWAAIERHAPRDEAGNSIIGRHCGIDTRGCIVAAQKRLIATVGVENLVVVETEDAILVCARDKTEKVKDLVEELGKVGMGELL